LALVVATGDLATGHPEHTPKTRYPKGPATAEAVEQNRYQLTLFDPPNVLRLPALEERQQTALTWVLLISSQPDCLRAELSLPLVIGIDDRIETWRERIILPAIPRDDRPEVRRTPESAPDVDVPVVRRTG
jgi:hypothetical protein